MSQISFLTAGVVVCALGHAQLLISQWQVPPEAYYMHVARIEAGPDGNLWFTYTGSYLGTRIGRITTGGTLTKLYCCTGIPITAGPDDALWVAGGTGLKRIATDGTLAGNFPSGTVSPTDVTTGPDGNLWFLWSDWGPQGWVAKMTTSGVVTSYPWTGLNFYSVMRRIIRGPDGNLWATEENGGILRITPSGTMNRILIVPAPGYTLGSAYAIAVGPDGALWSTCRGTLGNVCRLTPDGGWSYYGTGFSTWAGITAGPDGNIWLTAAQPGGNGLLRLTPGVLDGAPAFFPAPADYRYSNLVTGPDGCFWFFNGSGIAGGDMIGRACLPGPRITNVTSTNANGVYGAGGTIAITVSLTASVIVTGTPSLSLNSGGTATYATGSGTSVLTFNYTVGAGESSPRLDAALIVSNLPLSFSGQAMALRLNGGTIRDSSGNDALLLTPLSPAAGSLAANTQIVITPDSVAPVSTASAAPGPNSNGWNRSDVTVTSSATDVNGSGVKQIQYSLAGAQNSGPLIVPGSSTSVIINTEGVTTVSYFATDNAGNVEAAKTLTIRLDKTAPTVTLGAATPPPNGAGWNRTDVSVPFTVSDTLSGLDPASPPSPLKLIAEGTLVSGTVTAADLAGNTVTVTSPEVKIDKTPPAIAGVQTPSPNGNGWSNTAVTVTFSCTDALSGLATGSPPADTVLTTNGAGQQVTGICHDAAGNSASVSVTGINIDSTPPTASASTSPLPNASGWNNCDVKVSFAGTDTLSAIDSCALPVILSAEGSGQSASGTCTDKAGNVSPKAIQEGINIDKTPPAIAYASQSPATNVNGWNNSSVTLTWNCSDNLSGATASSVMQTLSSEGASQSATGTCADKAGNTAVDTKGNIKIDLTKPLITIARPIRTDTYYAGSPYAASYGCSDALSGVSTCAGDVTNGVNFDTSSLGPKSFTVNATDQAGNANTAADSYTVSPIPTLVSVTFSASSVQYSDPVTMTATVTPLVTTGGPLSGTITFASGSTILALNVPLSAGTASATLPIPLTPGSYPITATFTGVNPNYVGGAGSANLTVTQENTTASYTGNTFFGIQYTADPTKVPVVLSAGVQDANDGYPGDIRGAQIDFIDVSDATNPNTLCRNVPVALVNTGDLTKGFASCSRNVNLGNNCSTSNPCSTTYQIRTFVHNYYADNNPAEDVNITVAQVGPGQITGGGYLTLTAAAGKLNPAQGSKQNFGFSVNTRKNGNLQGHLNAIVLSATGSDGVTPCAAAHPGYSVCVYQIKSTALSTLDVTISTGSDKPGGACPAKTPSGAECAQFTAKGTINDVTVPGTVTPVSGAGNLTFQVNMVDTGNQGTDTIAFQANGSSILYYSSNWNGTFTIGQVLTGGNLSAH